MKTLEAIKEVEPNIRRIGVRDFVRNTKKYRKQLERGESFVLSFNGVDFCIMSPIKKAKPKYSKEDLFREFFGKGKDLEPISNEEIDRIVYDL